MSEGRASPRSAEAVRVEFRGVPAELWMRTRRLHEAMVRELLIIDLDHTEEPTAEVSMAVRAAVEVLRTGFKPFASTVRRDHPPIDEGVTLSYLLPADAIEAVASLESVFAEIDELARRGTLLTPPSSPDVVRVRRWFFEECRRQFAGEQPRPYEPGPDR